MAKAKYYLLLCEAVDGEDAAARHRDNVVRDRLGMVPERSAAKVIPGAQHPRYTALPRAGRARQLLGAPNIVSRQHRTIFGCPQFGMRKANVAR